VGLVKKTILIALRELRQKIKQRGFILSTIALPVIMIAVAVFTGNRDYDAASPVELPGEAQTEARSFGYVDQADLVKQIPESIPAGQFERFTSRTHAESALREGRIEAFYVIPDDYRASGKVERVSLRLDTGPTDTEVFNWILLNNLDPALDPQEITRLRWPYNAQRVEIITLSGEGGGGAAGGSMLPFMVGILVMMPLFTSGSYLFQSLSQEKSSRMLEILFVSIRPRQMLMGKLLGFGGLVLVQYLIWAVLGGAALLLTGREMTGVLGAIDLTRSELIWVLPYALGGFLLYAGITAGLGAMAKDLESSRVWLFVISLPMFIPFYLGTAIAASPNGTLAVLLSLIPFSAPVAMMLRITSTTVPLWQLALSTVLLVLVGWGTIALMARLFRAQTLLSGEALSLRKFWRALTLPAAGR
jgi:ABC-2 type transport system permease protein